MSVATVIEPQISSEVALGDPLISINHIERDFVGDDGSVTQALSDVNLEIRKGELISIIGPSGCGKTTLLRLISGLDKPQRGAVTFKGREIEGPNPERGYVFQQGSLFPWLTVEENIAFGLKAQGKYKEHKDEVAEYLHKVGLAGFEKSYPHQISGGMAQRVAIARALIDHPEVLLLETDGCIKEIVPINLAHRDRVSDDFTDYRKQLLTKLHFNVHNRD